MKELLSGPVLLTGWLFVLSLALFFTMGYDKLQAQRGGWRVPERSLFTLALLGGAIGGWLGMRAFRHKTLHRTFSLGFPALAILQAALWIWVNYRYV